MADTFEELLKKLRQQQVEFQDDCDDEYDDGEDLAPLTVIRKKFSLFEKTFQNSELSKDPIFISLVYGCKFALSYLFNQNDDIDKNYDDGEFDDEEYDDEEDFDDDDEYDDEEDYLDDDEMQIDQNGLDKTIYMCQTINDFLDKYKKECRTKYNNTQKDLWENRKNGKKPSIKEEPLKSLKENVEKAELLCTQFSEILSEEDGLPSLAENIITIDDGNLGEEDAVNYDNFFVYAEEIPCKAKGHLYEKIRAAIPIRNHEGNAVKMIIPARYCEKCCVYYISNEIYNKIRRYGWPLCKVVSYDEYSRFRNSNNSWAEESTLKLLGYTVNTKDNLSDEQRQLILNYAIALNIMTKYEIIDFLRWLIDSRWNKNNMYNAIIKWKNDIRYLQSTNDHRTIINVKKIIRKI